MLAHVQAGFDTYTAFAPAGWAPPSVAHDRDRLAELLSEPGTWALLALEADQPIGHVAFLPAREQAPGADRHWRERPVLAGVAHFWQLFVLPDWWGRGVAPALHDAAIAEMRSRGYERARLHTPSAHARARRFYERRGWSAHQELFAEPLQLDLIQYELVLTG